MELLEAEAVDCRRVSSIVWFAIESLISEEWDPQYQDNGAGTVRKPMMITMKPGESASYDTDAKAVRNTTTSEHVNSGRPGRHVDCVQAILTKHTVKETWKVAAGG